jgi:hypothetical protein
MVLAVLDGLYQMVGPVVAVTDAQFGQRRPELMALDSDCGCPVGNVWSAAVTAMTHMTLQLCNGVHGELADQP